MLDGVIFNSLPLSPTTIIYRVIATAGQEAPISDHLTPSLRQPRYIEMFKVGSHHSLHCTGTAAVMLCKIRMSYLRKIGKIKIKIGKYL